MDSVCSVHGDDRDACRNTYNLWITQPYLRINGTLAIGPHERLLEAAEVVKSATTGVPAVRRRCERMGLAT